MVVRRPPAPRLRPGRPGVQAPAPTLEVRSAATAMPPAVPGPATAPPAVPDAAAAPGPDPSASRAEQAPRGTTRRRTVLFASAAGAVVAGATATGTLLTRATTDSTAVAAADGSTEGSGAGAAAATDSPFPDVTADHPGLEAMRWADETGVQTARDDGSYGPDHPCTRGDLATTLHRFAGAPQLAVDAVPTLLSDLGDDPEQARALLWLYGRGALWADASLHVRPDEETDHDEAAAILTALLRPALAGVGATWEAAEAPEGSGSSSPQAPGADVLWLAAAGLVRDTALTGAGDGGQVLTRRQLATALHRADGVIATALG